MDVIVTVAIYFGLLVVGGLIGFLVRKKTQVDGLLKVDEDAEKIFIDFIWIIPVDDIPKKKYLTVEVVKNNG